MRVLHIGLGISGRQWLDFVRDHHGIESTACVDPRPEALDAIKRHLPNLRAVCFSRLDEALERVTADAAIVMSRFDARGTDVIAALRRGMPVLVEAPVAPTVRQTIETLTTARSADKTVVIAHPSRFERVERTLRQLIGGGRLGPITHVSCIDRRSRSMPHQIPADGMHQQLVGVAAHHFDSLRAILGLKPATVIARVTGDRGSRTEALLEMEGNIHVQYHGSLVSNRNEFDLWIEGHHGVLWTDGARISWRKRGWPVFVPIRFHRSDRGQYSSASAAILLQQLKDAAIGTPLSPSSLEDHVWTISMIDAAARSHQSGRRVGISELMTSSFSL